MALAKALKRELVSWPKLIAILGGAVVAVCAAAWALGTQAVADGLRAQGSLDASQTARIEYLEVKLVDAARDSRAAREAAEQAERAAQMTQRQVEVQSEGIEALLVRVGEARAAAKLRRGRADGGT